MQKQLFVYEQGSKPNVVNELRDTDAVVYGAIASHLGQILRSPHHRDLRHYLSNYDTHLSIAAQRVLTLGGSVDIQLRQGNNAVASYTRHFNGGHKAAGINTATQVNNFAGNPNDHTRDAWGYFGQHISSLTRAAFELVPNLESIRANLDPAQVAPSHFQFTSVLTREASDMTMGGKYSVVESLRLNQ